MLPLAASSVRPVFSVLAARPVTGTTLTSAPVSTRNWRFDLRSQRKSRPVLWPTAPAASGWPWHFPTSYMVVCIGGRLHQICDDNSIVGYCLGILQLYLILFYGCSVFHAVRCVLRECWRHHVLPTVDQLSLPFPGGRLSYPQPVGFESLLAVARERVARTACRTCVHRVERAFHP